MNILDKM